MTKGKTPPSEGDDKNPVGRPLKFKTVDELDAAINQYFGEQSPHIAKHKVRQERDDGTLYWVMEEYMTEPQPLTVSGLARALGISRDTLIAYKDGQPEFVDSIARAYERCHEYAESQLYGRAAGGASFSLKNNWGWEDKKQVDHTSMGKPMPLLGGTTPMVDDDEDGDDAPA